MDFDDWRRIGRGVTGLSGELDRVARRMREVETATRNIWEMDSAVSGYQEADSVVRSIQEEMEAGRSLSEAATGTVGLGAATRGAYDQTWKYLEVQESIERQVQRDFQELKAAGLTSMIHELASQAGTEDWRQSLSEAAERLSSAYAMVRASNFEELARRTDLLQGLTSVSPVIGMLARELAASIGGGALTPALAGGFGAELLDYIEDAEAVDSNEDAEEFLKKFLEWLLVQAQRLPGTKLNSVAMLNILLAIVPFLISLHLGNMSEQRIRGEIRESREEARQGDEAIRKEIQAMENRLAERFAQTLDDESDEYIVIKDANLREGPGKDFQSLKVLPPNVQVEEIEREGEWSRVRYFDYVEGEARDGWIATALLIEKDDDH